MNQVFDVEVDVYKCLESHFLLCARVHFVVCSVAVKIKRRKKHTIVCRHKNRMQRAHNSAPVTLCYTLISGEIFGKLGGILFLSIFSSLCSDANTYGVGEIHCMHVCMTRKEADIFLSPLCIVMRKISEFIGKHTWKKNKPVQCVWMGECTRHRMVIYYLMCKINICITHFFLFFFSLPQRLIMCTECDASISHFKW